MEKLYDTVVLNKDNYEKEADFWSAMAQQIKILVDNGNVCVVEHEDCGVYRVDFGDSEFKHYGNAVPVWITPEEKEYVFNQRWCEEEII